MAQKQSLPQHFAQATFRGEHSEAPLDRTAADVAPRCLAVQRPRRAPRCRARRCRDRRRSSCGGVASAAGEATAVRGGTIEGACGNGG